MTQRLAVVRFSDETHLILHEDNPSRVTRLGPIEEAADRVPPELMLAYMDLMWAEVARTLAEIDRLTAAIESPRRRFACVEGGI